MSRSGKLPLAGWRVLDLGIITAGAATSALLADAGAEVIKIESSTYPDPFRAWSSGDWNDKQSTSPVFDFTNRNKEGLALDLKKEEGREIFLRLVRDSDAVVENFRRGVLDKLGLGFERLCEANPRIVLASISSQGATGPDRTYASYGSTLEATGGLAAMTGYVDGPPMITGRNVNYPDQIVSVFAMGAVVAAVLQARRAGEGAHIDISQREVAAFLIGECIAAAMGTDGARLPLRRGNADPGGLMQGCYRGSDGRWLAVTIPDAEASGRIAELLGAPEPTDDALAGWVKSWPIDEALAHLSRRGAAAAVAFSGEDVLAATLAGSGHALAKGPSGELVKGFPFQSRRTPFTIHTPAPEVGRDTEAVLRRLLGISPEELEELRNRAVTAAPSSAG